MQIESRFSYGKRRDPEYGNEYLYLQIPAEKLNALADVRMSFQVTRHEHRVLLDSHQVNEQSPGIDPQTLRRFLQADRRVPLQGIIAELSAHETRGLQHPLATPRSIYNCLLATLRYAMSVTAWAH